MSKPLRKSRRSKKHPIPQKTKPASATTPQNIKKLAPIIAVVVLAAIPFIMGKYFELNYPDPYDSGANVYSAKRILEGATIGVEEKPSAALGTLLVNILGVWLFGFNEIGPKLIQGILQAVALVFMFISMRKLFGTLAAVVGVIIASIYLSSPLVAKFGNVKEQYMIAFMVIGISCFVLRQLKGRWWWAFLAGVFLSWAPLFKETGASAIGAVGLFVIAGPFLKHRTLKQTAVDILLLLAGAVTAIAPLYIWIIAGNVQLGLPYAFVWNTVAKMLLPAEGAGKTGSYVSGSRELVTFAQQWPKVLRFYRLLILPVALAAGAIIARLIRINLRLVRKLPDENRKNYDRFVLLLAVWWVLDMAFVWISSRSYEQYYLPLNASAAMLGGYLVALYRDKLSAAVNKHKWVLVGVVALIIMLIMSWPIFFGTEKSPHTGKIYDGYKRFGYRQKLDEISQRRKGSRGAWENVGQYIRMHSEPTDKIYVWGWFPGIYVTAQRFSSAAKACMMPRPAPAKLEQSITELLAQFEKHPPKFIVDSRKRHIPTNRPPYELWPIVPKGFMRAKSPAFLPLDKNVIEIYDKRWSEELRRSYGDDEADRYEALAPFRKYIMDNYKIIRMFGPHVLFELKSTLNTN